MDQEAMRAPSWRRDHHRRAPQPLQRGYSPPLCLALLLTLGPAELLAEEPWIPFPPPASGQAGLRISCAKTDLMLGQHVQVKLQVKGPAEVNALTLSAQVGTIDEIKRTAPGRWTARYRLPEEYFPQVAILTARAVAPGGAGILTGWIALRLWGSGEAEVKTRANSMVKIEIKGKLFGPTKANDRGVALVPVRLPPGVDHGFNGKQRVDLNLPPSRNLYAFLSRNKTDGTRPARLKLFLFAVNNDATAFRGVPLVSFSDGQSSPLQPKGPGAWQGEVVVPAGETDELALQVSISDSPAPPVELTIFRTGPVLVKKPVPPQKPIEPPRKKKSGAAPIYFWSALALSSSLLIAGTITRAVAMDMSSEYLDDATSIERRQELKPPGESLTSFSSVALGVGAGCLIGTAVLYWLTDFSGPEVAVNVLPSDGAPHIALSGNF